MIENYSLAVVMKNVCPVGNGSGTENLHKMPDEYKTQKNGQKEPEKCKSLQKNKPHFFFGKVSQKLKPQ